MVLSMRHDFSSVTALEPHEAGGVAQERRLRDKGENDCGEVCHLTTEGLQIQLGGPIPSRLPLAGPATKPGLVNNTAVVDCRREGHPAECCRAPFLVCNYHDDELRLKDTASVCFFERDERGIDERAIFQLKRMPLCVLG